MNATELLTASRDENLPVRIKGRLLEVLGQHDELLLIHGAIATPQLYADFAPSLAHLKADGTVWCYGKQVGTSEDIVPLDTIEGETGTPPSLPYSLNGRE